MLLNADVDVTMMMTEGLTHGEYLAETITTPAHALMLDMNRAGIWHRGRTTGQSLDMHGISGRAFSCLPNKYECAWCKQTWVVIGELCLNTVCVCVCVCVCVGKQQWYRY